MHLGQENVSRHFRSSPKENLKNLIFEFFYFLIFFFKIFTLYSDPFSDSEYVIRFKIDQRILEILRLKVLKRESE